MAIVSAAVAAVAAAVASTTIASVATAAVAVGTLVGTVGLGISVIGMATGNKTLTKIGGYLGMAGGVMTLGGGLAGGFAGYAKTLSTAWDDGVGSLFSSTKPVGQVGLQQEALGRGVVAGTNPDAAAHYAQTGQTFADKGFAAGAANQPNTAMLPSPDLKVGEMGRFVTPEHVQLSKQAQDIQAIANANPVGMAAPNAPTATGQLAATTAQAAKPAIEQGMAMSGAATSTQDAKGFFSSMPDWAKAQLAISGAQGLSGMLGGWFESASAEERLELERQAQAWRQQHEDKNQSFNQKNASYAPTVSFGGGVLNRGR